MKVATLLSRLLFVRKNTHLFRILNGPTEEVEIKRGTGTALQRLCECKGGENLFGDIIAPTASFFPHLWSSYEDDEAKKPPLIATTTAEQEGLTSPNVSPSAINAKVRERPIASSPGDQSADATDLMADPFSRAGFID